MSFNPDDFLSNTKVKDVIERFPHLSEIDFSITSLNTELVKLNYEITSPEYKDLSFSNIEDYYELDVDEIV